MHSNVAEKSRIHPESHLPAPDWGLFYTQHKPRLIRLCGLWVKDKMDAEDLAQEVLMKVIRSWDRFRGEAKPETWLYIVARNTCWTFFSQRQLHQAKQALLADSLAAETHRHPESLLTAEIDFQRILARSNPRTRSILLLRIQEGWTLMEIAQKFGVSHAAILGRISRAFRVRH